MSNPENNPLVFGFDVVHSHRTIFPVPLGLAATWDMEAEFSLDEQL